MPKTFTTPAKVAVALALLWITLSGCSRSLDIEAMGLKPVPGAAGLYYGCHGPTLIYASIWDGREDEYEAMWPGWCILLPNNTWDYPVTQPELFPKLPATTDGNTDDGEN